jgi:hypothetical protein
LVEADESATGSVNFFGPAPATGPDFFVEVVTVS